VQATWLALGLGGLIVVVVQTTAVPLVSLIAGDQTGGSGGGAIAAAALPWLRIAILGAPAMLVSLAGNGWMRGVQDTMRPLRYVVAGFGLSALLCPPLVYGWLGLPRMELAGSAVANVVGQWLAALLFGGALLAERAPLRLDRTVLRAQLVMARDLIVRTLSFQVCFISAAAVAARFGAAALAAHQVVLQLRNFSALVLDSLAIAAQALVGAALGGGDVAHAKSVAWRVTVFSLLAAGILAAALGVGASVLPGLFTDDRSVLAAIGVPWWFMVAQLPFAGIVFALDGVLLGAGDAAFMRTATVVSALVGFLPLIWLLLAFGWGLAGIWSGLSMFVALRLIFVGSRALSGRWAVTGTV
jgi:putative MATE family efflux protein